jgi:hypothetical protein
MSVGRRLSQWLPFFAWLCVVGLAIASWTPGEEMIRTGVRGSFEHIAAYFISTLMLVYATRVGRRGRLVELSQSMLASLKSARCSFLGDTANWKILPRVAWGSRSLSCRSYGFVERPRPCIKERNTRSGCRPAR